MKTIKERTINELRQVKDTNYQPPLSHEKVREEKNAYGVVDHLLAAYKILSEEDKKSATHQYILSSVDHLLGLLENSKK